MRLRRLHIAAAVWLVAWAGLAHRADAQLACDDLVIDQAESMYEFGWFQQAIESLNPCLPEGFATTEQRAAAYRLTALAYIATDSPDQAEAAVAGLLEADPGYKADPDIDNLVFRGMVDDLKPGWYTWMWRGNEWYKWVGRGALATGIVLVPLALRSQEVPDLPEAPADPQ